MLTLDVVYVCCARGARFSFEVATPEATYYMYAETEKEKDEWIGAIGRCVWGVRVSRAAVFGSA